MLGNSLDASCSGQISLRSSAAPDAEPSFTPPTPSAGATAIAAAVTEQAMARSALLASYYCVSAPTDPKVLAKLTKIRGGPVAEGVQAAKRVVEHAQLHLPGVRFLAMTLEFIKAADGTWWLLGVIDFQASTSVVIDGLGSSSEDNPGRESAVHLANLQRVRQHCRSKSVPNSGGSALSGGGSSILDGLAMRSCFLCGCVCEFSPGLKREVLALLAGTSDDKLELLNAIADYRMTVKMALETIYLLRQRGVVLATWEAAVLTVRRSPAQGVMEFPVCLLCYHIYKHQQSLQAIAHELHMAFGSPSPPTMRQELDAEAMDRPIKAVMAVSTTSGVVAGSLSPDLFDVKPAKPSGPANEGGDMVVPAPVIPVGQLVEVVDAFQREPFPPVLARHRAHTEEQHSISEFAVIDDGAVDPSSTQMRMVFFFHELQDGGPELTPTDFCLEYQLGQGVFRIHLEGSKCHTPNRWQLCEARVHYVLTTVEAFTEYCTNKKLLIKMKNQRTDKFFGYTVLSLKPVLTAAKWFGNALLPESRTDYLLELHTVTFGLLTLKLTVGLLVDPVPLRNVREVICNRAFLQERPSLGVYWPPPTLCLCGLAIPRDWVGALMPSEYISVLPMRVRAHSSGAVAGRRYAQTGLGGTPKPMIPKSSSQPALPTEPAEVDPPAPAPEPPVFASSSQSALSSACRSARMLASRIAEDTSLVAFPTSLLATILRQMHFIVDQDELPRGWTESSRLFFTRKLSLDQLLVTTRPAVRSTLGLLGELLLVLRKNHIIPDTIDAAALEDLVDPYWYHTTASADEWEAMPRTSSHLPERRAMWNRALRRCEAAKTCRLPTAPLPNTRRRTNLCISSSIISLDSIPLRRQQSRRAMLTQLNSVFRYEMQVLTLCELFEEMEALDNGFLDVAELRSLSKVHAVCIVAPLLFNVAGLLTLRGCR